MRPALTALCIAMLVGGATQSMAENEYPGGMPSGYTATDYDPRLTGIAREAIPLITAVDGFYVRHGRCPRPLVPGELAELLAALGGFVAIPHGRFVEIRSPATMTGWVYDVFDDPASCTLSRKLGWDPELVWSKRRDGARWIFVPGDGSDEEPIRLDP